MLTKDTNYTIFLWGKKKKTFTPSEVKETRPNTQDIVLAQENVITPKHTLLNLIQQIHKGMVTAEAKGQDEHQISHFKHANDVFVSEI